MKWLLTVIISACCATQSYADDTCENAVDAADSMNVNQQNCDYTDEGLNGVLHKAFKKGSEGAVLETAIENSADEKIPATGGAKNLPGNSLQAKKVFSLSVEVDQWSSVALARTQLLPKAMERCANGFSVIRENYRPLAMGRISLVIEFVCLD
ncbi:hypothetical protein [Cellvibrio sp. UBA7671]|uniref:hypothetical protein n=1 Tax=Cellvibrio sp. UBA7671 TaxID=1946312 RepID=UPI002F3557BB